MQIDYRGISMNVKVIASRRIWVEGVAVTLYFGGFDKLLTTEREKAHLFENALEAHAEIAAVFDTPDTWTYSEQVIN